MRNHVSQSRLFDTGPRMETQDFASLQSHRLLNSIAFGLIIAQQQVDEECHIGDIDVFIAIDIGTVETNIRLNAKQIIDEFGNISDVHIIIMVHVTRLVIVTAILVKDILNAP